MRDLMFAGIWLALLPVTLISAHTGVLVWVWVALLSPNELLDGFMGGVPFNKIVAITTILLTFVSRDRRDFYLDTTLTILLLLILTATVSWSGSIVSNDLGTDLFEKLVKEIALAFMITGIMVTRHRIHLLVLTVAIAFGFLAVKEGLISILLLGSHKILGSHSIGDNNALATALLMTIPLLYYLYRYSAVRMVRIGLLTVLALSLVTVIATFSRGGFIGLVVLGLFMVRNNHNKLASIAAFGVIAALTYALAPESWFERLHTISVAQSDSSFMGRVVAWKMSLLIALDRPFFGGGMHAVQNLSVWNTYKPFLPTVDFVTTPPADVVAHAAHSIYFEVLGDMGFTGLALFLAAIGSALYNLNWITRKTRLRPDLLWAYDLARMAQVSLAVYLITGAALSLGYFELFYIMLALISRCRRIVSQTLKIPIVDEAVQELSFVTSRALQGNRSPEIVA